MIPGGESLTVEFKSDRDRLPDDELVAAVVCLANTEGGEIYVGVEDDGRVTGLHPLHHNVTSLAALIANRTVPPVSVRVSVLEMDGQRVAKIEVPLARRLVARSDGLLQRRRLLADGRPECVPLYPHEMDRRESDLGLLDYSARPVAETSRDDFDPLERVRLRQAIQQYDGDRSLLALSDDELDRALGLVRRVDGISVPTVAGLLLLGREVVLREQLPTHEVAFQDLAGTRVRANEFFRTPLIHVIDDVMGHFRAHNREEELLVGAYRIPIPRYDPSAFREAFANAVTHRDYTQLGAVYVRWLADAVEVSNPGGFPEGVSPSNLLVTEPRPRNPLLADVFKRIGLVERTGRGVDIVFQGLLRYGRHPPDYSRSNASTVVIRLPDGSPDLRFLELVVAEEERTGTPLPVDNLLALHELRDQSSIYPSRLAPVIQKSDEEAVQTLERLVETGLAARSGSQYRLSTVAARRLGQSRPREAARRQALAEKEGPVLRHVETHGRITRREASELVGLSPRQATSLLDRLVEEGKLVRRNERRWTFYERRS